LLLASTYGLDQSPDQTLSINWLTPDDFQPNLVLAH
jgi:hypothetical protein